MIRPNASASASDIECGFEINKNSIKDVFNFFTIFNAVIVLRYRRYRILELYAAHGCGMHVYE